VTPPSTVRPGAPSHGVLRTGLRLARLHLESRRVLACLLILVACAVGLRIALHWLPRTGTLSRQIPLTIEAATAAAIGVTARSPFGDPERAAGRWLPFLRLATVVALAGTAAGVLAAGAASAHLAWGSLGLLRDVAGFTGIALLTSAALGGGLAWIGRAGRALDHAVGLACPAAARSRRCHLRRSGVRGRPGRGRGARRPRARAGVSE